MKSLRILSSDISYKTGSVKYLHGGADIGSGAFELKENSELQILLPRSAGAVNAYLNLYDQNLYPIGKYDCEYIDFDYQYDNFIFKIKGFPSGLYFFSLTFNTAAGLLFGMKGKGRELVLTDREIGNHFQFSITDFKYDEPLKYRGGVIYHIFVDRFAKGGTVPIRKDAIMMDEWEDGIPEYPEYPGAHLENNTFFGGTLFGIVEKLDYIKSLGTSLIYLSPIFEAYSNHKYDTGDYMKVDEMFGGEDALKILIEEAGKRDIGIILDGVFNHTGSDSVYFNREGRYNTIGAYQSKESPFYSWYDFKSHPDEYKSWWGIKILPRINPDNKKCGNYIAGDGGVVEKYAKLGIAGFRLDVADELSDEFISKIKSRLAESIKGSILYGEVWEDASNKIAYDKRKKYYLGSELDGVMNYPIRTGIISFLRDNEKSALEYALLDVMFNAPKRIRDMQMNLLGTHDTERIITILAGDSADGKTNAEISQMRLSSSQKKKGELLLKMAYTILATIPGIPTVFYGDEVGLEGYKDPFNRRPYPWKNANKNIFDFYKKIGTIRRDSDAFSDGDFELIFIDDFRLVFSRIKGDEAYITIINNSEKVMKIELEMPAMALLEDGKSSQFFISKHSAEILKTTAKNKLEIL